MQNKDSTGDDKLTAKALGEYYTKMTEDFPIVSIEDGFDQVCVVFRHISVLLFLYVAVCAHIFFYFAAVSSFAVFRAAFRICSGCGWVHKRRAPVLDSKSTCCCLCLLTNKHRIYMIMHRRLSLRTFQHPFPSHGTTATDLIYLSTSTLMCQDDWAGWIEYTGSVADKVQTVGDDLTVTNIKRIKKAADEGACNALLLKVRRSTCTMT